MHLSNNTRNVPPRLTWCWGVVVACANRRFSVFSVFSVVCQWTAISCTLWPGVVVGASEVYSLFMINYTTYYLKQRFGSSTAGKTRSSLLFPKMPSWSFQRCHLLLMMMMFTSSIVKSFMWAPDTIVRKKLSPPKIISKFENTILKVRLFPFTFKRFSFSVVVGLHTVTSTIL